MIIRSYSELPGLYAHPEGTMQVYGADPDTRKITLHSVSHIMKVSAKVFMLRAGPTRCPISSYSGFITCKISIPFAEVDSAALSVLGLKDLKLRQRIAVAPDALVPSVDEQVRISRGHIISWFEVLSLRETRDTDYYFPHLVSGNMFIVNNLLHVSPL